LVEELIVDQRTDRRVRVFTTISAVLLWIGVTIAGVILLFLRGVWYLAAGAQIILVPLGIILGYYYKKRKGSILEKASAQIFGRQKRDFS